MDAQTAVDVNRVLSQLRQLKGSIKVALGPRFELELAQGLGLSEQYDCTELADMVYGLVDSGVLRVNESQIKLGGGGTTNEPVFEDALEFSFAPPLGE